MRQGPKISPLVLERWLADAANPDECARVEAAYDAEERARMRASHAALASRLQQKVRPEVLAARTAATRRRTRMRIGGGVLSLAAAGAAMLLFARTPARQLDAQHGERAKGFTPALRVYRQSGSGAERLAPDAAVHAHETLQLSASGVGQRCALAFSIDGRGVLTRHHPAAGGDGRLKAQASGEAFFGAAYELDDAPDFERFWLVLGPCPLAEEPVLEVARSLARDVALARDAVLVLPAGYAQSEIRLRKEND
jgi:hypothetical protein